MSPKHRMPRLDSRDVVVVRDMLRFRALVTEHVARRTGNSIDTAYQTLERLTRLGLVQKEPNWIRGTELWTATQRGARAVKSRRKVRALWPGGLPHDLALVDLADQLLLEDPRATWRTEREIVGERARSRRRGEPSGTGHQPDGMLIVRGRRIAIELELHKKTDPDAYPRICRWYAEQVDIDGLRWYVDPGPIRARICWEIERHGLDADVDIQIHSLPDAVLVRPWALG